MTDHASPAIVPRHSSPPRRMREPQRVQRIARGLLAIFFTGLALYTIRGFLPSLIWGGIFAIAAWPLYVGSRNRWKSLPGGTVLPLIFTLGVALMFLIPMGLFALEAGREAQSIMIWMNEARHSGMPVPGWIHDLPFGATALASWWENHLQNPDDVSALLHSLNIGRSVQVTQQLGSQIFHRGLLFVFSILTLFFLLKDGESVIRQCLVVSRRAFGKRGEGIAQQIIASIHGTVAGLVLVGIGEGALMGVAYLIAGAPHPFLFGVFTAVAAMIPFCAVIAVGVVSLLLLVKGGTIAAIAILGLGLAVIFLADHLVRPALIGGSTEMPFLWVLTGILGGVESWNLLGLFLGPAIMAVLHMLWRNWTRERYQDGA
ncbi:AI-2E family transporter [Gluconacetobacter azotocaptans]|uniref:AI-2E family transporter n=1 Tax=Gluconacetobacter azotocaptans TaxID=142834 RepID=A0A7W4PHK6_9PROT|nr:AI-2E family transporter [Gluconacetobacter azotocaptans]MBM9402963.1 AI-2E family transporter [Gluconacetobacter azotocaptans]GBQ36492.1 permease [Gluconacetobacter azotocaptans DSM 13594]